MSVFAYPSTVIRDAERPQLVAGVDLMARAARALAQFSAEVLRTRRGQIFGSRVCVLAGPGNNAGDALYAAAALARRGVHITVITLFDRTHTEGLAAARGAGAEVIGFPGSPDFGDPNVEMDLRQPAAVSSSPRAHILRELSRSDLVFDAILGTGAGVVCRSTSPRSSATGGAPAPAPAVGRLRPPSSPSTPPPTCPRTRQAPKTGFTPIIR